MSRIDDGRNPMNWDCERDGCFNKKRRPKIEVFCDCFPRRINFGDVDGLVELNKKALLLEWKSVLKDLPIGQKIAYKNLTKNGKLTALCLVGDAETMEVTHFAICHKGVLSSWKSCNLSKAKEIIKKWVKYAQEEA